MTESNWISVKDRLPEVGVEVLTVNNKGLVSLWYLPKEVVGTGFWATVTHWQPLPEPPVAEEERDDE